MINKYSDSYNDSLDNKSKSSFTKLINKKSNLNKIKTEFNSSFSSNQSISTLKFNSSQSNNFLHNIDTEKL